LAEDDKEKASLKLAAGHGPDWWKKEIGKSGKEWHTYREHGRAVVKRYRDERDDATSTDRTVKKFNILFSNTETLQPAVYSQVPIPDIRRRWQDKDPVGRYGALVLQRATQYCIESYDFDGVLAACNTDYLLPGFAVARLNYKPLIKRTAKKGDDGKEVMGEDGKPAFDEKLIYQEANAEYVPWDRFRMSRSRIYSRVWWVAFGDDLTKDEVREKFGDEVADKVPYERHEELDGEKEEDAGKARIWEIWCKRGRGRFFVCEGFDEWVSKPEPDPLRLEGFFPNAKPIWSIQTNETLKPKPEYLEYQDQALELDDLTERIDVLTSAVRRRGVYDAAFQTMAGMLTSTNDNQFVPVENWTAFTDKGGLAKLALEMPLDGLINAIQALTERREVVKQTIYEITGISDIVRGASNPNETATAQNIKGQWAGLRVSVRQKKFAQFARDLVRLKAELIAERFDAQTLSLMTGIQLPYQADKQAWTQAQDAQKQQFQTAQQQHQQAAKAAQAAGQQPPPAPQAPQQNPAEAKFYAQPTWEEVIQLLRDDKLRGFKIDIETDSTVQPDADAEKQARTELLTSVADFCQRTGFPMPPQLAGQLITFTTRSYKVGSQMEQELEALENTNPGPTPQQQQKEKELQEREAKVKQAEEGAKDATHKAQMAAKDTEAKATKLGYDTQVFQLRQELDEKVKAMEEQVQQIRDDFARQAMGLADQAESTLRETLNSTGVTQ
jgi:hypothetical protein